MEVQIFVPAPQTFMVQIKHAGIWRPAKNWLALHQEARQVAEPKAKERWTKHQKMLVRNGVYALETDNLEVLMNVPLSPSMCYECPAWLAAKAIEDDRGK